MQLHIMDRSFARTFARRVLGRPSHALADATIAIHDRADGLELHIVLPHGGAICFAWLHGCAFLLPGTSSAWLTVDDLFGLEDVVNQLIADVLHRHRVVEHPRAAGVA